jgi:uncharacterized RmlC-like cupin family protein
MSSAVSPRKSPRKFGERMYDHYAAHEGIPVYEGFYVPNVLDVEVGPWARVGALGTIIRLKGAEGANGSYVMEIPAGGETLPQRHLYEEMVHIAQGSGATRIWNNAGKEVTFEWQAGSVFAIPLNCHYQHFNGSGTGAARMYAVTSAPIMMNLIHNEDFIFGCDFDFTDRFDGAGDFSGAGYARENRIWETNFIPDVQTIALQSWKERGGGGSNVMLEVGDSSLCAHVSQFGVGTYKKAHRHGAGAHVIILAGRGYSLLWQEGDDIQRVDWQPGAVVVPPERWFHQHFNTGDTPARYLAMRWGGKKNPVFKQFLIDKPTSQGGDQIEYEDEDPQVRAMFEADLKTHRVASRMDEITGAGA